MSIVQKRTPEKEFRVENEPKKVAVVQQPATASPITNAGQTGSSAVENPGNGPAQASAARYADFGELREALARRRGIAERRRAEAAEKWKKRIEQEGGVMDAFVARLKPEDTSEQQRGLRAVATGQALGELFGTLFGGAYAFGKKGEGYVPRMPGLAANTLRRIEDLKARGIRADELYRNRMFNILAENERRKTLQAGAEYEAANEELKRMDDRERRFYELAAQQARAEAQGDVKREIADKTIGSREKIAQERNETQRVVAGMRGGRGRVGEPNVAHIAELILGQKQKTTTKNGWRGTETTTTERAATKEERDGAMDEARTFLAPLAAKYDLTDREIIDLYNVKQVNSISWRDIGRLMARGVSIGELWNTYVREQDAQDEDKTPPSRRNKNKKDKVPPSRR